MATVKEMAADIGKKGNIQNGPLTVEVTVVDVKVSYNKQRWLVTPVAGSGEAWVESIEITN